jgi:hypothetical protein
LIVLYGGTVSFVIEAHRALLTCGATRQAPILQRLGRFANPPDRARLKPTLGVGSQGREDTAIDERAVQAVIQRADDAGKPAGSSRRSVEIPKVVPPVDLELLRALVRRKIPDEEARGIYVLIHTQKEWDDAYQQMLLEMVADLKARGVLRF